MPPLLMPLQTLARGVAVEPEPVLQLTGGPIKGSLPANPLPADPLPADPNGKRLCEIFGRYLYCSIYADIPTDDVDIPQDTTAKPQWHTQRRYKLKNRVLYRDWQDPNRLIGVRPGHTIAYALLDIDINSPYHPKQDARAIARIEAALETIGITRTLRIRSSWSKGIHLYLPLPEPVKTFDLAVALKNCLVPQGFKLKQGHLECFPNVKAYGNLIKTEYMAHRLPLQPASGSCLLNESFNPSSSGLSDFISQWDIAAAGQDIQSLQQALPLARKNQFKKVRNRLNRVESWKQDLETVLAEGWSGPGQTNQLLKEIGCYGHVFLEYAGEALVDFIYQQAISSPGYEKWCRHQREIRMRSRVWATAIEKYYWPIGSYDNARRTTSSTTAVNDLRAQSAQESIQTAVQQLEAEGNFPQRATARAKAIRQAQRSLGSASSSLETLYKGKNKTLWHPDCYVPASDPSEQSPKELQKELQEELQEELQKNHPMPVTPPATKASSAQTANVVPPTEPLKTCKDKKLRARKEIMKCVSYNYDVLTSSKTKFYSGKGGLGGSLSFPQATPVRMRSKIDAAKANNKPDKKLGNKADRKIILPLINKKNSTDNKHSDTHTHKKTHSNHSSSTAIDYSSNRLSKECTYPQKQGISQAVIDAIASTQLIVQKLGWPVEKVKELIAEKFQGRQRFQLSDDEVLELLYYLQVRYLESASQS